LSSNDGYMSWGFESYSAPTVKSAINELSIAANSVTSNKIFVVSDISGTPRLQVNRDNTVQIEGDLLVNGKRAVTEDRLEGLLGEIARVCKENELLKKFSKVLMEGMDPGEGK
jgi:hypothetical protein